MHMTAESQPVTGMIAADQRPQDRHRAVLDEGSALQERAGRFQVRLQRFDRLRLVQVENELVELGQVKVCLGHARHRLQFLGVGRLFLELLLRIHLAVLDLVIPRQDAPVGGAVEEHKLPVRRQLIHIDDGDPRTQHGAQFHGGKTILKILLHPFPVGEKTRELLQFRLRMIVPSAQHVTPGRAGALLPDAQNQNTAACVQKGVHALVPLLPLPPIHRHRFDLQPIRLQIDKLLLLDQVSQFVKGVINGFHACRPVKGNSRPWVRPPAAWRPPPAAAPRREYPA